MTYLDTLNGYDIYALDRDECAAQCAPYPTFAAFVRGDTTTEETSAGDLVTVYTTIREWTRYDPPTPAQARAERERQEEAIARIERLTHP